MSAFFFVCGLGALFALLCLQGADKLGIYCGAETGMDFHKSFANQVF